MHVCKMYRGPVKVFFKLTSCKAHREQNSEHLKGKQYLLVTNPAGNEAGARAYFLRESKKYVNI